MTYTAAAAEMDVLCDCSMKHLRVHSNKYLRFHPSYLLSRTGSSYSHFKHISFLLMEFIGKNDGKVDLDAGPET